LLGASSPIFVTYIIVFRPMGQSLTGVNNSDLRLRIVEMICTSGEGHIPSSFSIVDIIEHLYSFVLKVDSSNPSWPGRDFFVLSKGHGAAALFVVLEKHGFISSSDIENYGTSIGILGGHPDSTKVPGVEACTGSLGHGLPMAVGIALGLKIQNKKNRVYCLVGDGECQEGTIWEAANIATNQKLQNLSLIVDWNGSAQQLMPLENLEAKWKAFGWKTQVIDGHDPFSLEESLNKSAVNSTGIPQVFIAKTVKGRGVPFLEGHGPWHHKIPNSIELAEIHKVLSE
jgi:transketolase